MSRPHQAIAAALLLSGCAGQPQDAEAFRRATAGSWLPKASSLEVNRPFDQVSAAWREKAEPCLDQHVIATTKRITKFREIIREYDTTYKPTLVVTPERAVLRVQWHYVGELHVSKVPEGGAYRLVVDAYPLANGHTRLQLYNITAADDFLANAVVGWATGENEKCPDLTTQW